MHIFLSSQYHFHPILYEVKSCILFSTKIWAADNSPVASCLLKLKSNISKANTPERKDAYF